MTISLEAEALLAEPPVLRAAANEDFALTRSAAGWGWDPYEVWRTRIKPVQDASTALVAS